MTGSVRSSVARALVSQIGARVLGTALSFVTLAMTVRYLGATGFGLLFTALVFTGVFEAFAELGVGTAVVRRAAAGEESLERLVGLSLGMSTLYALPVAALAIGGGEIVYGSSPEVRTGIVILSVGLICQVLSSSYEPICSVHIQFGPLALTDVLSRALSLGLVAVAIAADLGLLPLFAINAMPAVLRLVVLVVWSRRYGRFRPLYELRPALSLLRQGLPFAIIIAIAVIYYRADGLLLSMLSDPVQVGAYGLAWRIVANAAVVPSMLAEASFSTLARAWHAGHDRFRVAVGATIEAIVMFAVPLGVFGVLLADSLVSLVAKDNYSSSATVALQLLACATALAAVNRIQAQALAAAHCQQFLLQLSVAALAANVLFNLVLIPRNGAAGAATALLLTELLSTSAAWVKLRSASGHRLNRRFLVRSSFTITVTLMAYYTFRALPALAVLGLLALVYAAALLTFEPVRVRHLRTLLRR